tara:strand:- start:34 stop:342 length:309 start_codon:yes stop_codon:yes gene_type:complete
MAGCKFATLHRVLETGRIRLWSHNRMVVILNTLALQLLFRTATVGMVVAASTGGFGLLNNVELLLLVTVLLAVDVKLDRMVIQPALGGASAYPINLQSRSID